MSATTKRATATSILDALACGRPGCPCGASQRRGHGLTHCPSHPPDSDPSLNVSETPDGTVLLHCFGGCEQDDVIAALAERGLWGSRSTPNGVRPPSTSPATPSKPRRDVGTQRHEARDPDGTLRGYHQRTDYDDGSKSFAWFHPDGRKSENGEIKSSEMPLFGIHRVGQTKSGIVAEGERAQTALATQRIPSVGTVTGASGTPSDDVLRTILHWDPIYLWPDNDRAGRQHMERIAARLVALGATDVRIIHLEDAPPKGDAADFVTPATTRAEMQALLAGARRWQPREASVDPAKSIGPRLVIRPIDEYESRPVRWLWDLWLARAKLAILAGVEGDGKSYCTAAIIASLSSGDILPDDTRATPIRILLLIAEDGIEDTVKPRLERHDADMSNILVLEAVREPDKADGMFRLGRHIELLKAAIEEYQIDLIVIDPLSSFLQSANRNDEGEMRDLLTPLIQLADDCDVAILGLAHLNRPNGTNRRPTQRILGSTAIGAVARIVWMLAPAGDEQDETRRVLAVVKSNVALKPPPLEWSLPGTDAAINWHGTSSRDISELLSGSGTRPRDDAEGFLRGLLADGPRLSKEIDDLANSHGIKPATLRRAKDGISVEAEKIGRGREAPWYSGLPGTDWTALRDADRDDQRLDAHHDATEHLVESDDERLDAHSYRCSSEHLISDSDHHIGPNSSKPHQDAKTLTDDTTEHLISDDDDQLDAHLSIYRSEHLIEPRRTPNACVDCGDPCGTSYRCSPCAAASVRRRA